VFQVLTSSAVTVLRSTRRTLSPTSQVISGQSLISGASSCAGPEPSSTKCVWRVAAQFGMIAAGLLAACVGWAFPFTLGKVVQPPRACAPMPNLLVLLI